MEHLNLYHAFRAGSAGRSEYTVEIGKANVVREGADVTIIAYGLMVHTALKAADELEKNGVKAEVIDLRTLIPLDIETIVASIQENESRDRGARSAKNVRRRGRNHRANQRECNSSPGGAGSSRRGSGYGLSIRANRRQLAAERGSHRESR